MKTERHQFIVKDASPPTIEVDTEASAVYIRFKRTAVAKTVPQESEGMHIAVDLDAKGEVVGIEAIGFKQFSLEFLLKAACVKAPKLDFSRAQYVPAELAHS